MVCVFPRKEEGHLLPVAEPARHLDKSHAGPRPQRELPARRSRGQTFAPPGRRLSRPHWPLRPGVLHEKQKRPRLQHPSCCLIAHLEIRCSETQETKGSEGRACAFRAGAWAPWLYRSLQDCGQGSHRRPTSLPIKEEMPAGPVLSGCGDQAEQNMQGDCRI